jgi:hypothetical protein
MTNGSLEPYEVKDPDEVKFINMVIRLYDPLGSVWISKDTITQLHAGAVYAHLLTKRYVIEREDHTHFRATKELIDNVKMIFKIK